MEGVKKRQTSFMGGPFYIRTAFLRDSAPFRLLHYSQMFANPHQIEIQLPKPKCIYLTQEANDV